jgi:small nuclear ribonucleoprotein (snRNP)-like protein
LNAEVAAGAVPSSLQWKQQLHDWGAGAWVRIKLANGKKLHGQVDAIEEGGFLFNPKGKNSLQRLGYDQLAEMRLARSIYKAPGLTDSAEVRRVAMALGAGRHVATRLAEGRTLRGHIQAIEQGHFALLLDEGGGLVQVPYSQVRYLEQNLSRGAKFAIIFGAIGGTILLVLIQVWTLEDRR